MLGQLQVRNRADGGFSFLGVQRGGAGLGPRGVALEPWRPVGSQSS